MFDLIVKGKQTTLERKSSESSVTIPFEQTFRNLESNRPTGGQTLEQFNMCGCGWPQHMLLPKGTAEGMPCVLFAMVSNYEGDKVTHPFVRKQFKTLRKYQLGDLGGVISQIK